MSFLRLIHATPPADAILPGAIGELDGRARRFLEDSLLDARNLLRSDRMLATFSEGLDSPDPRRAASVHHLVAVLAGVEDALGRMDPLRLGPSQVD